MSIQGVRDPAGHVAETVRRSRTKTEANRALRTWTESASWNRNRILFLDEPPAKSPVILHTR